jgi:hypothetical protein
MSNYNNSAKTTLNIFAVYLTLCGLSAILYPRLWLISAGLTVDITPLSSLAFAVLGGYILALAIGSYIAASAPSRHHGLVLTLLASQVLDLVVTCYATFVAGLIPQIAGMGFIVVTLVTSGSLGWIARGSANSSGGNF